MLQAGGKYVHRSPRNTIFGPKKIPSMRNKGLACPKIHMAEMLS